MVIAKTIVTDVMNAAGYTGSWELTLDLGQPRLGGGPYDNTPDPRSEGNIVAGWRESAADWWRMFCQANNKWYWVVFPVTALTQVSVEPPVPPAGCVASDFANPTLGSEWQIIG